MTNTHATNSKMKFRLFIGLMMWMMLAGCSGSRLVQHSTTSSDSTKTVTKTETVKSDSSFFRKDVKEVTLEGSTVQAVYSKAELDSLIAGLQKLPSVSRTIYMADPKMRTTLAIVLDSLGRISFRCTTAERTYYESSIEQGRVIDKRTKELVEKERTIRYLEEQIKQYEQAWYVKLGNYLKNGISAILFIAGLLAIVYVILTIRKWKTKAV